MSKLFQALRDLEEVTFGKEWFFGTQGQICCGDKTDPSDSYTVCDPTTERDAQLICALRNEFPRLIEALDLAVKFVEDSGTHAFPEGAKAQVLEKLRTLGGVR